MRVNVETWGLPEGRRRVVPLRRQIRSCNSQEIFPSSSKIRVRWWRHSPAGMMTDKAVAEADLMTLVPDREFLFSPSAESCW